MYTSIIMNFSDGKTDVALKISKHINSRGFPNLAGNIPVVNIPFPRTFKCSSIIPDMTGVADRLNFYIAILHEITRSDLPNCTFRQFYTSPNNSSSLIPKYLY